jgi:hypothetical protein
LYFSYTFSGKIISCLNDKLFFPIFLYIFHPILGGIAHNIPAVYGVWAGIKELCVAKTAASDIPSEAGARKQTCYAP